MQYVKPCPTNSQAISIINMMTEPIAESISKSLSYEAILEEATHLNHIERNIPDILRIQLELNTIATRRSGKHCYETLLESRESLVSIVSSKLGDHEGHKLNESYRTLASQIKSLRINEQGVETLDSVIGDMSNAINSPGFKKLAASSGNVAGQIQNVATTGNTEGTDAIGKKFNDFFGHDEEKAKAEYANSKENDDSIMGMLSRLYKDLTEGGSPIGILHLVLDIVGVIGDFPLIAPIGLIADLLNAVIYFLRGKMVLGMISLIGAMIPFAGPVIKNIFKGSKAGGEVFSIWSKLLGKGNPAATKEALQLAAKASPRTKEALIYTAKLNKTAMGKATTLLGKFFNGFLTAVVGWIPLIGTPLSKLFKKIGSFFDSFSVQSIKASDDILQGVNKTEVKMINDFMEEASIIGKGDGVLKADGNQLIYKRDGLPDLKLDASVLAKGKNMSKRYGETLAENIVNPRTGKTRRVARTSDEIEMRNLTRSADAQLAKFYANLHELIIKNEKLYKGVNKWPGLSVAVNPASLAFLGKQIVKYLSRKSLIPTDQDELVQKGLAGIALNTTMQDLTNKLMKENKGSSYAVPYVDAFTNNEAIDALEGSQNMYAEALGLPKVGHIGYFAIKNSGNDCPRDMREMFNKAYPELEGKRDAYEVASSVKESKTFKYIKGFDSFI